MKESSPCDWAFSLGRLVCDADLLCKYANRQFGRQGLSQELAPRKPAAVRRRSGPYSLTLVLFCGNITDVNSQNKKRTTMSETITPTIETKTIPTAVALMERLGAAETFATPEAAKQFIEAHSYEDFSSLLNRLNGLQRNIPTSGRHMDGGGFVQQTGVLSGSSIEHQPPLKEDREPLMRLAYEAAQQAPSPEDAALILGLSINAIHPYEDGNGRTSRFTYMLLEHGYNGTDEDNDIYASLLENTKGREVVDLDPSRSNLDYWCALQATAKSAEEVGYNGPIPTYIWGAFGDAFAGEYSPENIAVNETISNESRKKLYQSIADRAELFALPVMLRIIKDKGLDPSDFTKHYPADPPRSHDRTLLEGDKLIPLLSEKDIDFVYAQSFKERRNYVLALTTLPESIMAQLKDFYRPKLSAENEHQAV